MKLTLLALVCVLSVAHAARQVVLAPPPPPAKAGESPGILFSYDIPGYTSSSFGSIQQAQLCSLVQSTAEGRTGCVISSFIPRNTSVAVGGYMTWEFDTVPSAAQIAAAAAQRDASLVKLKANTTLVSGTFAGAVQNCECTDAFSSASSNPLVTSGLISALPGLPLAGCNQFNPPAYATVAGTTAVESTENTVGIDSGKYCSGGIVVPATGGVSVEVTSAGSGYITAPTVEFGAAPPGGVTAAGTAILFGSQVQGVQQGSNYQAGSGCPTAPGATGCAIIAASDQNGSGATCAVAAGRITTGVADTDIIITAAGSGYVGVPTIVVTGCTTPPAGIEGVLSGSGVKSITLTNAGSGYITAPSVRFSAAPAGGATATGEAYAGWNPRCDSDPVFYQANFGTRCPQCTNGAGSKILFDFNGPNTGRFCGGSISGTSGVGTPLAGAVSGTPRDVIDAAQIGSSCIKVGVYTVGADSGKPCVGNFDVNNQIAAEEIADTISSSITQYFASDVNSAIGGTTCASVYRNTEFNVPCSTPKLSGPPAAVGATLGENGKGACNTFSTFYSQGPTVTVGGTPTLSTGTGQYQCLLTAQTFVQAFTPAPAPSVPAPAPTPSAPVPAPSPAPVPSPPAPVVCVYRGTYRITPLYAPCSTYYIASGTDDNCSNNLVNLRTKNNLGQKFNRASWTFSTESKGNLGKPTNVLANARTGCTNKYLAAPSDPTTLKVGGSAWKWQFVPYPGNDKCDEVNMISQNRITTTAFLQVPRSCDRFRYNATDGGRQRFRLRPVA